VYLRSLAVVPLAALALGLAACGEDAAPADSQSSKEKLQQAELKFAQCMREQGIDFPDPQQGRRGLVKVGEDSSPEEIRAAEKACEEFRKDIKPPELSEEQKQEFKDAALAHARCMREHGIDFPDPTFSADGGAQIRLSKGRVDPEDADFKAAEKECADKLPAIAEKQP
jgi:hypothetical protein